MSRSRDLARPSVVGHPFSPIGMGESMRSIIRALRAARLPPRICDVVGVHPATPAQEAEFGPDLDRDLAEISIFHVNGDEVKMVLDRVGDPSPGQYRIVCPMWELANYPEPWARALERFDEVWAASRFVADVMESSVARPVTHLPYGIEVRLDGFLGRRHFGIPESAYAFLFFFDFRSYAARKNPEALLACFTRLMAARPRADVVLVVKTHGEEVAPEAARVWREALADIARHASGQIVFVSGTWPSDDVKNLVRACDCFVSLHRSEGFGLGIAEAMALGRPVIATGYSGNMDFCGTETNLLVDYTLIPVRDGQYPFAAGQVWADPDIDHAVRHMATLIDDPARGRELGRRAAIHMRTRFSYRAAGLRYLDRLRAIAAAR